MERGHVERPFWRKFALHEVSFRNIFGNWIDVQSLPYGLYFSKWK